MKNLILIGLVISISTYAQKDTIVKVNNNIIVGEVVEITPKSVFIIVSESARPMRVEISERLVGFIKYENGEVSNLNYNKWRRISIKDPLLKDGIYFDVEIGNCLYQRTTSYTNHKTDVTTFSKLRNNFLRIGLNVGNRWSIYKTPSYNLSLGANWLNLSFSPTEFDVLYTDPAVDWMITAGLANPEFTNIFVLSKNSAIEVFLGGGYMRYLGEDNHGFMVRSGWRYRYKKIGLGANYIYGRSEGREYGFPISLNTINFSFGLKF